MWVVVALCSLGVLVALVLSMPVNVVLDLDTAARPKFRVRLTWLFGLVSKEVRKREKKPEKKRRVVEGKPKPRRKGTSARTVFELLRTKGLLRQFKHLLKGILRRLRVRDLRADFKVGLENPADTGLLFSLIGPATFLLGSSRVREIRIEPSFADEAVCEGYLHGAVRVQPIQLVAPCLKFVCSLAAIRVVKKLVVSKWKRKK